MRNVGELISENIILARKIRTDHHSFSTTPVERMNLSYCEKRLKTLENQWESLEKNHQLIMNDEFLDINDDYLRNSVRDNAEDQYKAYGNDLSRKIVELEREENVPVTTRQQRNIVLESELGAVGGGGSSPIAQPVNPAIISQVNSPLRKSVEDILNYHRIDNNRAGNASNTFQFTFDEYAQGGDRQGRRSNSETRQSSFGSQFNSEQRGSSANRESENTLGGQMNPRNDGTKKKTTFRGDQRGTGPPHGESLGFSNNDCQNGMNLQWVRQHHENSLRQVSHLYADYMALNPQITSPRDYRLTRARILRQWRNVETTFQTLINSGCQYDRYDSLVDRIGDLEFEDEEEMARQVPRVNHSSRDEGIRIPKVEVPQFEGDILKWATFKTLFNQMIGSKANLSNTQKMVYLTQNVKGEAAKIVASLQISDESYDQAWALLDQRYSSQYRITTHLTDRILNLEAMKTNNFHSLTNLLNTVTQCISGLINAGVDANHDSLSIFLHNVVIDKVDKHTLAFYENKIVDKCANRRIQDLLVYLQSALHDVQNISRKNQNTVVKENGPARQGFSNNKKFSNKNGNGNSTYNPSNTSTAMVASAASNTTNICGCKEKHKLYKCPEFTKLNAKKRYGKCKELKRCVNCFYSGHLAKECTGRKCSKCNKGHNTLLHFEDKKKEKTVLLASAIENEGFKHIFLATVMVNVIDQYGKPLKARALLDSGSQLNMLSESMYKKLGVKSVETSMYITGVGCSKSKAQKRTIINLESQNSSFKTPMEVFVVKKMTTCQPAQFVDIKSWNIPTNVVLADPKFNVPAEIDIVIGGELFFKMMSVGQKGIGPNLPDMQNTVFGWVVIGKLLGLEPNEAFVGVATLEEQLNEFWKIEEKSYNEKAFNEIEQACENYYDDTTRRDPETGKFIVNLQFLKEPALLGQSTKTAVTRFYHLENKFKRDPDMKMDYVKFMREYKNLGHMKEVAIEELGTNYYVIPHHAVRNPDSSTTAFRVVFDASAKSSSNYSLNNILANGPMLQDDLFSIMVRFRKHKYVFSADITKMYRQVLVAPEHQKYQVIVWRENPEDKLKFYKLLTVTYGTTCASYLAIKSLQRLADENKKQYPLAAIVAKRDFNVDDIMTGSNDLSQLKQIQSQLVKMLEKANFNLHKWCSNNSKLLENIPREKQEVSLSFNAEKTETKALGMKWIPSRDEFMLHYSPNHHSNVTKRTVLSETAQLFDPLGLVNPVIVLAKIFQQDLWNLKLARQTFGDC